MKSFQMPGQKGSIDDKGVVQWTVPYFVEDLADVLSVGAQPPLSGLIEVGRNWSDDGEVEGVGVKVEVTYEGFNGDPEDQPDTYEFDSSFREEPIVAHANWYDIKKAFNGRYDSETKTVTFSEFLDERRAGLRLVDQSKRGERGELKNPFFGVETFLALSSVFRHTYVRSTIPASIFERIGTIQNSIPGGFPTPEGRNWLVMPPKISQRGGAYQITEELMLSQPDGWPEAIYSLIT